MRFDVIIFGQDIGRSRAFTALVILGIKDGIAYVLDVIQWPHTNKKIFVSETAQLFKDYRAAELFVDATGMGTFIPEDYERVGVRADEMKFSLQTKHDMIENMVKMRQSKRLMIHKKFAELLRQMRMQMLTPGSGHTPKYTEPSGDFDDQLWALCLACWGARKYIDGLKDIVVASRKLTYGHQKDEWGSGIPQHLREWKAGERSVYYP